MLQTLEQGVARAIRYRTRCAGSVIVLGTALALLLALPAETVSAKYVNDLFVFLDGGYRVVAGQSPNVDFHSSLGPLTFLIPALGFALAGNWSAAMPVGLAITVVALTLAAAHIIATRMRPIIGIPLAAFFLLVAAAPLNPGEGISELTFAMFYNRLGWCALGLLLVMYLTPESPRRRQVGLDAICSALLILIIIYLKITYALVMLGFMIFMLFDRRQWRWPALSLALVAAGAVVIELAWGGTAAYLADLRSAAAISGDAPDLRGLLSTVLHNLADITVFALFALLLLACRRSLRDFLFLGFCAGSGILIIAQNFQTFAIVSLAAGAAVAAEALARRREPFGGRPETLAAGAPLLLLALLLPATVQNAAALALHASFALSQRGEPIALPDFAGIRLVRLWQDGAFPRFSRYNETLRDGAQALAGLHSDGRVLVMDFVGPFTAGMGLKPARGDSAWYHWGRTIGDRSYPPAQQLFSDVDIVMEPKAPIEKWTAAGMKRLYADYLAAHFTFAAETEFWKLYRAKPAEASASSSQAE